MGTNSIKMPQWNRKLRHGQLDGSMSQAEVVRKMPFDVKKLGIHSSPLHLRCPFSFDRNKATPVYFICFLYQRNNEIP